MGEGIWEKYILLLLFHLLYSTFSILPFSTSPIQSIKDSYDFK